MTAILIQRINALPDTYKAVLLALVSTGLFNIVGALVRLLSDNIEVFQILFFRQLVFTLVLLPSIKTNLNILLKPKLVHLHLLRVTGAFCALSLGFITVSNLPFAEATALGFTRVLFVALIARIALSESVGKLRQLAILVGFMGVMMVLRPSFESASVTYMLTGLGAAMGAAIAVICVRKVAKTEPTISLLTYQALFVGLLALVLCLPSWQWPTMSELLLLIMVGVISSIAQWIGVTAYKFGEANIVSNVEYVKIIYSMLLGYFLFAEMPDAWSFMGAGVIMLSAFIPQVYKKRVST